MNARTISDMERQLAYINANTKLDLELVYYRPDRTMLYKIVRAGGGRNVSKYMPIDEIEQFVLGLHNMHDLLSSNVSEY